MNQHHLDLLKQGAEAWNQYRKESGAVPDLAGASLDWINLYHADLSGANCKAASFVNASFNGVNLSGADLENAFGPESNFSGCNFENANLKGAKLMRSTLDASRFKGAQVNAETDLSMCNLIITDLSGLQAQGICMSFSQLSNANLSGADFSGADLSQVVLVGANVSATRFTGARIHGISAWDLQGRPADESGLIITRSNDATVTVDDLEVAQFVYLILNNQKIRDVIDTVTTKTVLILGRFSAERKQVLDAIREQLHKQNYVGIIFDFDPSEHRNLTETVSTLAHMARFVIADITQARSIGQELTHIIPQLPSVPIQPIVHQSDQEWAMFNDLKTGGTVLPTFRYRDMDEVLDKLQERILTPVDEWFKHGRLTEVERLQKQLRDKERELREKIAELEQLRSV
jgi:uncharacterized protein YjbI with pentapeptide repeats